MHLNQICETMYQTDNSSAKQGCSHAPKDACQSPTISNQEMTSGDIVFLIMQRSDCDFLLAEMRCP